MANGSHGLLSIPQVFTRPVATALGWSASAGLWFAGGAAEMFDIMKSRGVVVHHSPLYWMIDGASILNYPASGDPNVVALGNGAKKPTRTQILFKWSRERLQKLWDWAYANGASFAGAVYTIFNALPFVQFALLGSQWGDVLKPQYPMFATEAYWVSRMTSELAASGPNAATVRGLPSLLANMLIARIDFLLRFVMSMLYGHYFVTDEEGDPIPVLHSTVGYMGIPDGGDPRGTQSLWAWSAGARTKLKALRDGPSGSAIDADTLKLMAELAWLAYEEGCVIQDVLDQVLRETDKDSAAKAVTRTAVTLEFFTVHYNDDGKAIEKGVDTQCLVLRYGNLAVVAFRGTQPISFFGWAYNFTLSALHPRANDPKKSRRTMVTRFKTPAGHSGRASAAGDKPPQIHEGFSEALGLPLQTIDNQRLFVPTYTRYYHTHGTPGVGKKIGVAKQEPRHFADSPYKVIADALRKMILETAPNVPDIYITGHSLGGALAALFTTAWCSDNPLLAPKTHMVTFGQPRVGDRVYALKTIGFLGGVDAGPDKARFARVTNLNDCVTRVPTFFTDSGDAFVHADGANTSWYIDEAGSLQGPWPATPPFYQLARQSWLKLKTGFTTAPLACPVGVSELDPEPEPNPGLTLTAAQAASQSSLRLLMRAAMTPLGVFNDHIDYKALLRQLDAANQPKPATSNGARK